ncbi:MAG: adenylate/guanylate cyclase domain-containing protein [Pyrinomonadaceae bacterium]
MAQGIQWGQPESWWQRAGVRGENVSAGHKKSGATPVTEFLNRAFESLFGDARHYPLEHRLFNTVSLLNAITNFGGAFGMLSLTNDTSLLLLHIGTGVLFLACYYLARFRGAYRPLYWPFVLLTLSFVFVNALENAGTLGGAHYYLIPALVIAIVLSDRFRNTVIAIALFTAATVALVLLEQYRPDWIKLYANASERAADVHRNLLFVQIFTGVLVMTLSRNLNQERAKSDRLLLNVLPAPIAQELKQNDRVVPLDYENASVLFTDFVGFTRRAERLTPQELIGELDHCFAQFDQITKRHKLEKIKTIGDAYMAVGGVPRPNQTHAVDCVLAALEIQRVLTGMMAEKTAAGRPRWQLRVGINTGGMVAGVIGREKFAYDVWGDTVNTASRLESSGVADEINVSQATYEEVREFFVCEYRGKVAAKSKGEIDMYFVKGIRPELSAGADGQTPNELFAERYERLSQGQVIAAA